ncbi:MAG: hypothetical protein V3T08_08335, partial [Gemmatimonadota bacterium]
MSIASLGVACIGRSPAPLPIAEPGELASRLSARSTPREPQLIEVKWRYRGRDGRFAGDGAVRVNPPDSVRLDLLGPGWSGVQSAVLLGDELHYVGEQRVTLPPPMFLWAMLGVFRPPAGIVPKGSLRGDRSQLGYDLSERERVIFEFDGVGRLVEAERQVGGHAVQEVRITRDATANSSTWPKEARFRDLGEFHEVRVQVTKTRVHAPFERDVFDVAAHLPS